MNVTCKDRERIFEDGTAAEWAALEAHAASCAACAEEIRTWKSLSVAAKELQEYSPSPGLWARIERSFREEDARKTQRAGRKRWFSFLPNISLGWQTALAGALVLILTVSVSWILVIRDRRVPSGNQDSSLLERAALKEVEGNEHAYENAIDKLTAAAT